MRGDIIVDSHQRAVGRAMARMKQLILWLLAGGSGGWCKQFIQHL